MKNTIWEIYIFLMSAVTGAVVTACFSFILFAVFQVAVSLYWIPIIGAVYGVHKLHENRRLMGLLCKDRPWPRQSMKIMQYNVQFSVNAGAMSIAILCGILLGIKLLLVGYLLKWYVLLLTVSITVLAVYMLHVTIANRIQPYEYDLLEN